VEPQLPNPSGSDGNNAWPAGGGGMGARVRAYDWSSTRLGAIATWPQSLKSVVELALAASLPTNVLWGRDLVQIYNDAYVAVLGSKHPVGLGQPGAECWPEAWNQAGPLYDRLFAGETVVIRDGRWMLQRQGRPQEAWFDTYLTPIRNEAGQVAGAHAVAMERTEDRAAAAESARIAGALRESKSRLRVAADLVGLARYNWNPRTNALHWDARTKAMWGLPPDARISYETWRAGVHPDDLARVEAAIAACTDPHGDGAYDVEYRVRGNDGVERWVASRGHTVFENGVAVDFTGVALDITAAKRAEERLRDNEGRLAALLEQLPAGVGLFDTHGKLTQSNRLLRSFIGGALIPSRDPDAEARWRAYRPDGSILPPTEYPGARALRGETITPGVDFLHTQDDGPELWTRVSAAPFRDAHGQITGAVTIIQDITNAKRAEQTHLLLISELQHRTRNLLAVVEAMATEMIASSRSLVEFGAAFSRRLAALARVQDLLSRGQSQSVSVDELVRLELRALGAEPDGSVHVEGPDVTLPNTSIQVLALALHELATNARKHGAMATPGGTLSVTWQVLTDDGRRRLALDWHERGVRPHQGSDSQRKGFGRVLIEESLPFQLDAQTRLTFLRDEVRCTVTMPLPARTGGSTGIT
jgi:PAS domain S-box-containing protein